MCEAAELKSAGYTEDEKNAAAFLRERFLFLIASLPAQTCKINMYNKTEVTGQLRAFDLSFENAVVDNLKPPNSDIPIPRSILRTSDIVTIRYENL